MIKWILFKSIRLVVYMASIVKRELERKYNV